MSSSYVFQKYIKFIKKTNIYIKKVKKWKNILNIIKEEVDKFLLKEYSSIAPYKENLSRIVTELSNYFNDIKQDIIARKNMGDNSVSLNDITVFNIRKTYKRIK